jgi:N-acetylneuraminate synthase
LGDIETALAFLAFGYCRPTGKPTSAAIEDAYRSRAGRKALREKVSLLHCTTEYPAPFEEVNLRAMRTLAEAFGLPVGLSDHTPGIAVPIAAVACGATIIEKHFTLDKDMPGPDHKASLDLAELRALVRAVREVEAAMGSSLKMPSPSELRNRPIARKSLVAAVAIRRGEILTPRNVTTKRPGTGVSAVRYFEYLGRTAERSYRADELI